MHDQFLGDRLDLGDMLICKRLHNGKDIMATVELAPLGQDVDDIKISRVSSNRDHYFRSLYHVLLTFRNLLSLS
jgi:hypothetical protein